MNHAQKHLTRQILYEDKYLEYLGEYISKSINQRSSYRSTLNIQQFNNYSMVYYNIYEVKNLKERHRL
jgi:hypothetical protein